MRRAGFYMHFCINNAHYSHSACYKMALVQLADNDGVRSQKLVYTYIFCGPWYVRVAWKFSRLPYNVCVCGVHLRPRCSPPLINLLSVVGEIVRCCYQL
jgi:hypothetical protein